jgi:hypothetical protein
MESTVIRNDGETAEFNDGSKVVRQRPVCNTAAGVRYQTPVSGDAFRYAFEVGRTTSQVNQRLKNSDTPDGQATGTNLTHPKIGVGSKGFDRAVSSPSAWRNGETIPYGRTSGNDMPFKFRAETLGDVFKFFNVLAKYNITCHDLDHSEQGIFPTRIEVANIALRSGPVVTIEIQRDERPWTEEALINGLTGLMTHVEDGHVMRQTVQPAHLYTGERNLEIK